MEVAEARMPKAELELFSELKDIRVVFDVGARTNTDYLKVRHKAKYHLFEPNPIFCTQLIENVGARKNVIINNFGLGDRETLMGYQSMRESFVESAPINNPRAAHDLRLSIKTLDWYIKKHRVKHIDFLKIDTEGFEVQVIKGGINWLPIIRFIQYEHWGDGHNEFMKNLIGDSFEYEYVGYRNTFCMSKALVSEEERTRLKALIRERGYALLEGGT